MRTLRAPAQPLGIRPLPGTADHQAALEAIAAQQEAEDARSKTRSTRSRTKASIQQQQELQQQQEQQEQQQQRQQHQSASIAKSLSRTNVHGQMAVFQLPPSIKVEDEEQNEASNNEIADSPASTTIDSSSIECVTAPVLHPQQQQQQSQKKSNSDKDNSNTAVDEDVAEWMSLRRLISTSRRILIVTGAGISVSSGIPDFRSEDGLFETLRRQYPRFLSSGSDLFDARLFSNPVTTQLFYRFMGQFRRQVVNAEVTPTHKFMKELELKNKLLRVYSQNIDGLERKVGLDIDIHINADTSNDQKYISRSKSATPTTMNSRVNVNTSAAKSRPKAVLLHGELNNVICTLCREETEFTAELADRFSRASPSNLESRSSTNNSSRDTSSSNYDDNVEEDSNGNEEEEGEEDDDDNDDDGNEDDEDDEDDDDSVPVQCSNCANIQRARFAIGKRTLGTGFLRPNIVLYNEEHPDCDRIGILSEFDLRRKPDLLLVMGTSLRIPGVIRLVKEAARTVQSNGNGRGKVIYVNKTAPTTSRWRDLFDYHLEGDADIIVTMLWAKYAEIIKNNSNDNNTDVDIEAYFDKCMQKYEAEQKKIEADRIAKELQQQQQQQQQQAMENTSGDESVPLKLSIVERKSTVVKSTSVAPDSPQLEFNIPQLSATSTPPLSSSPAVPLIDDIADTPDTTDTAGQSTRLSPIDEVTTSREARRSSVQLSPPLSPVLNTPSSELSYPGSVVLSGLLDGYNTLADGSENGQSISVLDTSLPGAPIETLSCSSVYRSVTSDLSLHLSECDGGSSTTSSQQSIVNSTPTKVTHAPLQQQLPTPSQTVPSTSTPLSVLSAASNGHSLTARSPLKRSNSSSESNDPTAPSPSKIQRSQIGEARPAQSSNKVETTAQPARGSSRKLMLLPQGNAQSQFKSVHLSKPA